MDNTKRDRSRARIDSLIATVFFLVLLIAFLPSYYDLNDEMVIESILAGKMTGVPSAYGVYIGWILGLILSGIYLLTRAFHISVPVWGLFLTGCYGLSFYIVMYTLSLQLQTKSNKKFMSTICSVFLSILLFGALFLKPYIIMNYTVTSSIVAATAIFYILVVPNRTGGEDRKQSIFWETLREAWPLLGLLFLSFEIRNQVCLLSVPFVLLALLLKFTVFEKEALKSSIRKMLYYIGYILILLVLGQAINRVAYSNEWNDFSRYNKVRTDVYDYTNIPDYCDNTADFYQSIGLDETDIKAMQEYDILLLPELSTTQLEQIATYAREQNSAVVGHTEVLKMAVIKYKSQLKYAGELQLYVYILLMLHGFAAALCLIQKKYLGIVYLLALGIGRSVVWIYFFYKGRFPQHVEESLYIIEMVLCISFIIGLMLRLSKKKAAIITGSILAIGFCAMTVWNCNRAFGMLENKRSKVEQTNKLLDYFAQNDEKTYAIDVYSYVEFSQPVLHGYRGEDENFVLMGGWLTGSPITAKRFQNLNVENAVELVQKEDTYFVIKEKFETDWIISLLGKKAGKIELKPIEHLETERDDFVIYQVQSTGE